MARVTEAEVRLIIEIDSTVSDLTPFITLASLLVSSKLESRGLSEGLLKEIERWLAAHFIAIRDPRSKSESVGDISVTYGGTTGEGLKATLYGQQAIAIDPSGTLERLNKQSAMIGVVDYTT